MEHQMIGIDIVDLKDPLLKKREQRSLDLISHPDDQLIKHPMLFWLLWTAKEAIYKCHRQAIDFAPKSIPVHFKIKEGQVEFYSESITGKLVTTEDYILAVCSKRNLNELHYEILSNTRTVDSSTVRAEIIRFFTGLGYDYQIGSDKLNLPVVTPSKELISLSHHRQMGAFAFPKSLITA